MVHPSPARAPGFLLCGLIEATGGKIRARFVALRAHTPCFAHPNLGPKLLQIRH
jgi:hypothetical protein